MGSDFKIAERYAKIISYFFIIMMYSAAMPILYFAGSLICFTTYWSDKTLFLRHYRLPPVLGRRVGKKAVRKMEFAILVHFVFGAIMLTNEDIFPMRKTEDQTGSLAKFSRTFMLPMTWLLGLNPDRF